MENNSNCLYIINILPFMNKSYFEQFLTKLPHHILVKTVDVIYKANHIPSKYYITKIMLNSHFLNYSPEMIFFVFTRIKII